MAVALILAPLLLMSLRTFLAGGVETRGIEAARVVALTGFLYLLYRGFRLIRWIVLLYTITLSLLSLVTLIRNVRQLGVPSILLGTLLITSLIAGVAAILFAPAIRAFLLYQLGGRVPYPTEPGASRGLTSA